jgi:hypothetical protein
MGSGERQRVVMISFAVVVSLALGSVVAAPAAARLRSAEGWTLTQIETARELITHVPDAIRPSCSFESLVRKPGASATDSGVIADVRCRVAQGQAADSLNLLQFDTQEHLQSAYEDRLAQPVATARPVGCDGDASYTVQDVHAGRSFCSSSADSTAIVYTYEPLLVLGFLNTPSGGSADIPGLVTFWNDSAGPNRAAGSIPSLLGDKAAKNASNDLRKRIPAPIRPSCTADRESFVTPWVAASWQCEHPSTGVYSAVYTSYRDRRGLDAAFDPDAYAATSELQNTECPFSGTWKSGGKIRGRYACTVDQTSSSLSWSLDDRLISVDARAYDAEMTTKEFLEWWNDKAGPLT